MNAPPFWQPQDPPRADRLAFYLLKAMGKAIRRYRMLSDGDNVLLAVSGGKDSMTLLDLMVRRQHTAQERCQIQVGLVRSDAACGRQVPEEWLRRWCEQRQIALHTTDIAIAQELAETTSSTCFRCSWHRRRALFEMAATLGCNTLAFGHHADDIVETILLNLFFAGTIDRMEPKAHLFGGKLLVIRPLCLIEERDIMPFVRANGYPIQGEPCPAEDHSRRTVVRNILRDLERESPQVKRCIYGGIERHLVDLARLAKSTRAAIADGASSEQGEDHARPNRIGDLL